jgi:hypothetical protein
VTLPFAIGILAVAFGGWLELTDDRQIIGWRYAVPVDGTTDAWAWQAANEPLATEPPRVRCPAPAQPSLVPSDLRLCKPAHKGHGDDRIRYRSVPPTDDFFGDGASVRIRL